MSREAVAQEAHMAMILSIIAGPRPLGREPGGGGRRRGVTGAGRLVAAVALAALLLAGGGCGPPAPSGGGGPLVVASFSIIGDMVRSVAGEAIDLRVLVGPGGDAHTFEPSPSDSIALARARLVFEVGIGFEPWMDGLHASSRSTARRVALSDGLALRPADGQGDEDHDDGEFDPHVWQDVANAALMVEAVRDALAAVDPGRAPTYRANAERYLEELAALDRWVAEQVSSLPPERRRLVTAHDTLGYMAERYGLEVVGTLLGSASTEAGGPSSRAFAALVSLVRESGAPAVFPESVSDTRPFARLAAEAGVAVAPPLYTDALSGPPGPAATYIQMVRYNVETIVEALRP